MRAPMFVVVLAVCAALGLSGTARADAPRPSAGGPIVTGQRISLDLKGVDILDVLKLFSQKTGLNFIAGRNLSGRVTIFVNDVDVWDAFELIIKANDLAYERRSAIVTVMMARDYELLYGEKFQEPNQNLVQPLRYAKAAAAATVLNQIKSSVGKVVSDETSNTLILNDVPSRLRTMQEILTQIDRPTETHIYSLNYATAEKLKEKVQELLSPVGTFTFDARTNKVIISDASDALQKVDQLVRAFDTPEGEVLIEAKIVKVELTDAMDMGIDWQQLFSGIDLSSRLNFRVLSDIVGGTTTGAALKLATAPKENTKIIIEALKKVAKTDTLSSPRIMVSNNQEAKILVGKREAVVTVTTTVPATGATVSAPTIEYVDVGTKLYVTPNIKPDGQIQMKIKPEVSTADVQTFQTNRIPIVTTTEAETNVLVRSGTTLIIGGFIETKDSRTKNQVPILGDIPLLGIPFRGVTTSKTKTELVVFLTPQIIRPDGTPLVLSAATAPSASASVPEVTLRDPVSAAYRSLIRQRLQAHLLSQFRAAALQQGSVVVSFILSHDGRVIGEQEITSPEGEPFIVAARAAIAKAQPFPPFPAGSEANEVRFRLAVDYAP